MQYSLRSVLWAIIVVCLGTTLILKIREARRISQTSEILSRDEAALKGKVRAIRYALADEIGTQWKLERNDKGELVVKELAR